MDRPRPRFPGLPPHRVHTLRALPRALLSHTQRPRGAQRLVADSSPRTTPLPLPALDHGATCAAARAAVRGALPQGARAAAPCLDLRRRARPDAAGLAGAGALALGAPSAAQHVPRLSTPGTLQTRGGGAQVVLLAVQWLVDQELAGPEFRCGCMCTSCCGWVPSAGGGTNGTSAAGTTATPGSSSVYECYDATPTRPCSPLADCKVGCGLTAHLTARRTLAGQPPDRCMLALHAGLRQQRVRPAVQLIAADRLLRRARPAHLAGHPAGERPSARGAIAGTRLHIVLEQMPRRAWGCTLPQVPLARYRPHDDGVPLSTAPDVGARLNLTDTGPPVVLPYTGACLRAGAASKHCATGPLITVVHKVCPSVHAVGCRRRPGAGLPAHRRAGALQPGRGTQAHPGGRAHQDWCVTVRARKGRE